MTSQVIPDAAVEALACLLAEDALFADPSDDGWNATLDSSDHFMPRSRIAARIYLEAAAPHLIQAAKAEAWDDGRRKGMDDERFYETTPNPYC